jgi:hypothetical protein
MALGGLGPCYTCEKMPAPCFTAQDTDEANMVRVQA